MARTETFHDELFRCAQQPVVDIGMHAPISSCILTMNKFHKGAVPCRRQARGGGGGEGGRALQHQAIDSKLHNFGTKRCSHDQSKAECGIFFARRSSKAVVAHVPGVFMGSLAHNEKQR